MEKPVKFPKETLDEYTKKIQENPDGDFVDMKDLDDIVQYAEWANARITELEQLLAQQNAALQEANALFYAIRKLMP